ncbi:MAG: LemA family protein [Candidatus Margulisbacteria bacterium]|nr:LemA family protein [Candidatus Margulisiibacteriota bacterium]MBU1021703.1 LemA family protein [Candidatus Margulisiibacteriota bacterium]MBU1729449.1 LemA family protein [Candidatus Margulisiibacteriota bacterium]MBU1955450.1 LemA family protein [Candidatus Margulisiibacteriota bacterium]
MIALWIILAIIVLVILFVIAVYNGLIKLRTRCEEAWSDIDIQLKRRYNLIPNLMETVKGYAAHEKGVFQSVTEARTKAMGASGVADKAKAENMLSQTLKSLFAVAEAYPDLKANQNFLELQRELRDTEDKITYSRRFYNTNVRDLNIKVQTFPSNMIANMFGFTKKDMFELTEEAAREVPKVKF